MINYRRRNEKNLFVW